MFRELNCKALAYCRGAVIVSYLVFGILVSVKVFLWLCWVHYLFSQAYVNNVLERSINVKCWATINILIELVNHMRPLFIKCEDVYTEWYLLMSFLEI